MKISMTPHKHVLVSHRAASRYNPRSFLASIVRSVAPQFSTADFVATSLGTTNPFTTFLCTVRLDHLLNRYVRSVNVRKCVL
jgi:hypothetical protein